MATININSTVSDPFYRYKMPRLVAKVEGKGNGIKTVLVNIDEVGRSLNRPPTYPTKFFGCELGAQTQMDEKNSRYIVNGAHEAKTLQELLDKFIKRYVLCFQCENPETDMRVSSKGIIQAHCVACGWRGELDNTHRLATFIVKHPPKNQNSISSKTKAKLKKREDMPEQKEKNENKIKKKSEKKETEQEKTVDSELDSWSLETNEEAVRKRREALEADLGDSVKGLTLTEADYMDIPEKERLATFKTFARKVQNNKQLYDEAVRLNIRDKAITILFELRFDENVLAQIKQYKELLLKFCNNDHAAQFCLLGNIERLVGMIHPNVLSHLPHILKMLYDLDIIEEEVMLHWGNQTSSKYVCIELFKKLINKAEPVLNWLREASEDESESDIEYVEEKKITSNETTQPSVNQETEKDEIDIDDI